MGNGFSKMKKQARQFEQQYQKMQEELKLKQFEGTSGAGLVKIIINGEKEIIKLSIKPECIDPQDPEILQDLIIAAYKEAYKQIDTEPNSMSNLPFSF